MKITALIIDDDADSRMILRAFMEQYCPQVAIAAEAASVAEGFEKITELQPDLLLLDIEMKDGTGFDLLRMMPQKKFEVIFITAYDTYAVEAFKYTAIGYLLKPVLVADLVTAVQAALERIRKNIFESQWMALSHNLESKERYDRKLAIATSAGYVFVNVKEISWCESQANYTAFHFLSSKKIVSSRNLGFYEELLPVEKFCRIHHSSLVNVDYIEKFNRRTNGGSVIMMDGTELDVSQRRKEEFLQYFLSR
ncbi:LytR/AlgR family response regulator transcription factor [Ferruginibacter sp.]